MKSTLLMALVGFASALLACSKADTTPALPESPDWSEIIVVPVSGHSLSSAEVFTADVLFARNHLDNHNMRYTQYSHQTTQTYFPPYDSFSSEVVGVEEYTNGLPIFTGVSNFLFKDGVFTFRAGHATAGTTSNAVPTLTASQLRGLFSATISQLDPPRNDLETECVSAEFGYYDLNAGRGSTTENLVKAWRVSVKNQLYPFAYFQDNGGKLIYYDNGIRTLR